MIGRRARSVKPGLWRRALAFAAALAAAPAHACDCRRPSEPSPAIATETGVIFAGRAIEIRERSEHVLVTRETGGESSVRRWSGRSSSGRPDMAGRDGEDVCGPAAGVARPGTMIVVRESALVLAFPAFALWAARTGGTGRLWRVTAVALALVEGTRAHGRLRRLRQSSGGAAGLRQDGAGDAGAGGARRGSTDPRGRRHAARRGAGSAADGASTSSARLPPSWLSCWGGSPRCTSSARSPEPGGDVDGIRHSDILRSSPFCRARSTAARNAQWASTA